MCWVCDHPEATRREHLEYVRAEVDKHCWVVIGVQRHRFRPPYSYTVGLTNHGSPEFVVTGLPSQGAADLLNDVAAHLVRADAPPAAERVPRTRERAPLTSGPLLEIVSVSEPTAHLQVAAELFGPGLRAIQLVYADDRGRWPWDSGFRGGRGGQPVLGPRAA